MVGHHGARLLRWKVLQATTKPIDLFSNIREKLKMKLELRVLVMTAAAVGVMGMHGSALASSGARNVVVNGTSMDHAQLAYLDQMHCMAIPDGNYFLKPAATGAWAWGYAAVPGVVQGYLGENCYQGQAGGSRGSNSGIDIGWNDAYTRTYGGGVSAGDGTYEYYDGASGSFNYE